jgi:putative phosphoesterase
MQIAITSDIHNNEVNLGKVLRYCAKQKIDMLICCGDLASKEVLDFLSDNFSGTVYYTFGNADYDELIRLDSLEKYRNIFLYKSFGEIKLDKKKIAFSHFPRRAQQLAKTGKYSFVFYGHTHKPWEEMFGNCKMLNPGNVAGEIYLPTFAIWDTKNDDFKLIRIHDLK